MFINWWWYLSTVLKQYMSKKPTKWGIKLFVICSNDGIAKQIFFVCQRKDINRDPTHASGMMNMIPTITKRKMQNAAIYWFLLNDLIQMQSASNQKNLFFNFHKKNKIYLTFILSSKKVTNLFLRVNFDPCK